MGQLQSGVASPLDAYTLNTSTPSKDQKAGKVSLVIVPILSLRVTPSLAPYCDCLH